jgi:hypothetical protein
MQLSGSPYPGRVTPRETGTPDAATRPGPHTVFRSGRCRDCPAGGVQFQPVIHRFRRLIACGRVAEFPVAGLLRLHALEWRAELPRPPARAGHRNALPRSAELARPHRRFPGAPCVRSRQSRHITERGAFLAAHGQDERLRPPAAQLAPRDPHRGVVGGACDREAARPGAPRWPLGGAWPGGRGRGGGGGGGVAYRGVVLGRIRGRAAGSVAADDGAGDQAGPVGDDASDRDAGVRGLLPGGRPGRRDADLAAVTGNGDPPGSGALPGRQRSTTTW